MGNNRGNFGHIGPSYLTRVDWNNVYHRKTVAASLVKGAYMIERERSRHLQVRLAPPWWEFFNFKLIEHLEDDRDHSYFGAIYEYTCGHVSSSSGPPPPRYVIAFRGTNLRKARNWKQDSKLDLRCIFNNLHNSTRFLEALRYMDAFRQAHPGSIWLAGHSLGSSIALLIDRHLIKNCGIHLETYLFNPPFASTPTGWITSKKLKFGIHFATSFIKVILATALVNSGEAPSAMLPSTWAPNVFVNPSDIICSGYIGYFKHRETMEAIGAGGIERIATKYSVMSIVAGAVRQDDHEVSHFIPRAHLFINSSPTRSIKENHELRQWWKQDLRMEYNWCANN